MWKDRYKQGPFIDWNESFGKVLPLYTCGKHAITVIMKWQYNCVCLLQLWFIHSFYSFNNIVGNAYDLSEYWQIVSAHAYLKTVSVII